MSIPYTPAPGHLSHKPHNATLMWLFDKSPKAQACVDIESDTSSIQAPISEKTRK
jgi:hypothetical protein